jgi:hypothetical protein
VEEDMSHRDDEAEYRSPAFSAFVEDHKGFGAYRDDWSPEDKTGRGRRTWLVLSLIVLLILAAAGGWWLRGESTLAPIDHVTTTSVR